MDIGDIEKEYSSGNLFSVVRIKRESGFSQDAQYRPRKSPRKRLKVARTTASLVIDQLKSIFWRPGDFTSRVRTRRNWPPEFSMRYLRDNRRSCNEGCDAMLRHGKRNFVPEAPKIYSIGLHTGAKCLSDDNDRSISCSAIRKRFSTIRRPTIICKYWVTQSSPTFSLSTDVSLKAHTDRQTTTTLDCTESTEDLKYDRTQDSNYNSHRSQLYQRNEQKENISDNLPNHSIDDRSFKDPSTRKDDKCSGSSCRMTRDVQIQTSSRKSARRRKTKKRSKPVTEKIFRREHCDNEPEIVADVFTGCPHSSRRRSHYDEPWLRVRVLENKRAEYINKFTAVNRQIEEITAALRETCDYESSQDNLENCDEYFSSMSDDANVNMVNWSGVESGSTIARRRNTSREKNGLVKKIIGESKGDRCKNLCVDNLNNETALSRKDAIETSRNPEKIPNSTFGHDSVVYFSNRISRNKTKGRRRCLVKMDLTKNEDKNELFGEVGPKHNFAILDNDARDSAESPVHFEEPKYCRKIVEEKIGEVAILEDIKKRIDQDFDDLLAERSENDTEDFLSVSRKSSSLDRHYVVDVSSLATTIEGSKSTKAQVHASTSIGAMSECSNKNSTLSKYFSCTQIPSLISLTENENELTAGAVDRSIIDSHSSLSSNNRSLSNLDLTLDRSCSSLEYIARYDQSVYNISPNKFPIETVKDPNDTFELSEGREASTENKICKWECSFLGTGETREKRCTADSTLETSKSSRYIGSIDSGVFSSSLIDLHPVENFYHAGESRFKKQHRSEKIDESLVTVDSGTDDSCTDDTLDRKVNDVVRDLTKNLVLCERRARMKLRARDARCPRHILSHTCKLSRNLCDTCYDFFDSPRRSSEDERIVSISTPSLLSLSDSEIEECEQRHQQVFC